MATKLKPPPKELKVSTQHAVKKIVVETPLGNNITVEFGTDGYVEDVRGNCMVEFEDRSDEVQDLLDAKDDEFRDFITMLAALREEYKKIKSMS